MKNRSSLLIASISMLVFTVAAVTAAPPTSYYLPLETSDPTCAPGDVNCDVELSFLTTEIDGDITNELQDLILSGSTLSLSGSSTTIDLSPFAGTNTDNQTLSLSGSTLSITGGNNVLLNGLSVLWSNITGIPADIADGDDDTQLTESQVDSFVANNGYLTGELDGDSTNEIQALDLTNNILSLSGSSDTIDLSSYANSGTDNQTLSLSGSTLEISGGNSVSLPSMTDTDDQTLSLSGTTLSIDGGNSSDLSPAIVSLQPWFGDDDDAGATLNTEDIYTRGKVSIGKTTPGAQLSINTIATSIGALEAGSNVSAAGNDSVAFGRNTTANGIFSIASGDNVNSVGGYSAAFGRGTTTTGLYSLAAGDQSTATGNYSAVLGRGNTATGLYSFAHGQNSIATGTYSYANGFGVLADSSSEYVIGRYNIASAGSSAGFIGTNPLFVIGNGISNTARSNAMTVLKNGNVGIGAIAPDSKLSVVGLPSGTTDAVTPGSLAGAVCITDAGNMYIDTDGTCAN